MNSAMPWTIPLEAINGIQAAVAGKTVADYQCDWVLKHAVQRGTEIISEASRGLPDEVKALQPDIPGRQVRTIGNVLRHEYHGLADNIIWVWVLTKPR
ncbi:HepT-like ribonuclease domain-containing protein [Mesorhizobium sp. M1378]|uniref:HepT-like ribonuclease domain-containing protein n=1 Tax=Mesorhizobium sp. M1378 TaxID=2957092 RepID=UPI00333B2374